jgi:hypothetical protein
MDNKNMDKSVGWWFGIAAKIVLAIAMLLYLGMHSLNFFTFTFKDDQFIFSILGLFTTSIGFLLWLAIYLWVAEDNMRRAIAIAMMFISLMGEFAVAAFDMYMNISGNLSNFNWTVDDLRNMSYLIAGLALLNGFALVLDIAGENLLRDFGNIKLTTFKKNPANTNIPTQPKPSHDTSARLPERSYATETGGVKISPNSTELDEPVNGRKVRHE